MKLDSTYELKKVCDTCKFGYFPDGLSTCGYSIKDGRRKPLRPLAGWTDGYERRMDSWKKGRSILRYGYCKKWEGRP